VRFFLAFNLALMFYLYTCLFNVYLKKIFKPSLIPFAGGEE